MTEIAIMLSAVAARNACQRFGAVTAYARAAAKGQ